MRNLRHPYKIKTKIQLKDGSVYWKRWLYFRPILSLDVDIINNLKWKKIFLSLYNKHLSELK